MESLYLSARFVFADKDDDAKLRKSPPLALESLRSAAAHSAKGPFPMNVQQFRGGLVFMAQRLCASLSSRLESKKEEKKNLPSPHPL